MIRIAGTFKVAVLFYDSKTGGKGGSDRVVARGVFFFFLFSPHQRTYHEGVLAVGTQ